MRGRGALHRVRIRLLAGSQSAFAQKLVILGFDGMDPDLAERWMKAGQLPNFAKLAAAGGLFPLETTHSPESRRPRGLRSRPA